MELLELIWAFRCPCPAKVIVFNEIEEPKKHITNLGLFSVSLRLKTYQYDKMPLVIDGKKLYRIGEALAAAPVSRATYFRWLKQRRVPDTQYRDRNGRRLFTDAELEVLKHEAQRLVEAPQTRLKFDE